VNFRLRTPFLGAIAIGVGAVVLLGYFIQIPFISGLRQVFLTWAVILTAVALAVGVVNLLTVHFKRIRGGTIESVNSLVLVASLLITFAVVVFFGLTSEFSVWIFNYILLPVEASLIAILAVVLLYALVRLFYRSFNAFNIIFAVTAFFMLAATAALLWIDLPVISVLRDWISDVWSLAGARAILIGVALGAAATGLRVLIGADRPYEG
jgi:hypothetical protein